MNLVALAKEIEHLNYVVMRNWEKMPPEGDIDFFVSKEDADALHKACLIHLDGDPRWFDIRTFGDRYYPPIIEDDMLTNRQKFGGWWIPNPGTHFASLMYHQLVHKGDRRYQATLDKIFIDNVGLVEPREKGVGFHDPRQA